MIKPKRRVPLAVADFQSCAANAAFSHQEHDEIGAVWHFRISLPQGFGIAIAQALAHPARPDKRRVADDELRLWPFGGLGLEIVQHGRARLWIWHLFARDGMHGEGLPVPAGDRLARIIQPRLGARIGQHCIAVFDISKIAQDRLRRAGFAVGTEMPLQIADPQAGSSTRISHRDA